MTDLIREIAERLSRAERVLFITGAGISADSGLPTYRGIGGLYDSATTDDGIPIELALSGAMMAERPELTWKHLAAIERHCREARPNDAHEIIARIEGFGRQVLVLTQNVDGFHGMAGSSDVIEIHGSLRHLVCCDCSFRIAVNDYAGLPIPPECPDCGAILRPDVVLFGESLRGEDLVRLAAEVDCGFDLVFSVGTSSLFPYIVEPVIRACECGVPTVEINPGETPISELVDYRIRLGASEAMTAIWRALEETGRYR